MKQRLRIAMMVRSFIPMPRPHDMIYAPIDLAVAMAKGLGARGHQVTLFSPLGTEVYGENVTVETLNLRPLVHNQPEFDDLLDNTEYLANGLMFMWDQYMATEMYRRADAGEYDVVYFHHPESGLSLGKHYPNVKAIYTLHDPIYDWHKELYELYQCDNQHFISISNNQRRDAPDLNYLATVYNGTDMDLFKYSSKHDNYLLFSGRITAAKGVREAIQVARESQHKLLIIGPVAHGSQDYFNQYVKPELDENILYLGRMDQEQLTTYYQKAKALLTPIQWEEPFGLTTIEAMACGTPVISLHRGAAPEIIENGKSGFVVPSIGEMTEAIQKIDQIDRRECRRRVKELFTYDRMVDEYERVLLSLFADTAKPKAKSKPKKIAATKKV